MMTAQWASAKRVLLIRLDNLGDVLVTTPAIRAVRCSLPDAQLTLLCSPIGAQVGRMNPDIDNVIEYSAPWMDPWGTLPLDTAREDEIRDRISEGQFDAAIIFTSFRQSTLPAAYLCYLAGIPLRLGASVDGAGSLLTTRHKHDSDYSGVFPHEVFRSLDLVRAVGMEPDDTRLRLAVDDTARLEASEFLSSLPKTGGPLVAVHPGCSMPARTYPRELFRVVVDLLHRRLDATVVVTGTKSEGELATYVVGNHAGDGVQSAAGRLSFPGLCALIEASDLVVSNNTGPMHIAAATQTPVVVLFALTNPPRQWAPWQVPFRQLYHDVECRICYSRVCPVQHECLRLVTPDMVIEAAAGLISESLQPKSSRPVSHSPQNDPVLVEALS